MNCILYARVSTEQQAERDLSIPAQLNAMRDYARAHDWVVVGEFVEPGASAKTTDRPVLQKLLSAVRDGEPQIHVVLVHKIDRLARNVYDHAAIKVLLKQHDVRLASVVENVDDSVPGQLVENIMASIAQFYSANLSDETKKGMRQKVLQGGWPHRPPRGYVVIKDGTDSHIEEHPREGPLVRRAFELYSSGWYSVQALGRTLAKAGLISRSGGPIPKSQLHRMLTNPFYVGRLRWQDLDVAGVHPPLVPLAMFAKVRTVIKERYRDPGRKSKVHGLPLRGLATCASCRGRMSGEWHDRWGYYRCGRRSYRRELCRSRMCNAKRAHADLERLLLQTQIDRATAAAIQCAADRLIKKRTDIGAKQTSRIAAERTELLAREMRLTDAFTTGDLSPEVFKAKGDELRQKRAALDRVEQYSSAKPENLSAAVARALGMATAVRDLYDQLNDDKQAELLREVFTSIIISHEGIVGYSLKPPLDQLASPSRKKSGPSIHAQQAKAILDAA
ncbi:MAG TPA: recombinase family protein [Vicinamibacterales bacterium]|nr:recombinase family protein [Vicinamibacterales bacterium]